jgi:hypothetical protein
LANVRIIAPAEDDPESPPPREDELIDPEQEAEATRIALKRKIAKAAEIDVIPRDLPSKLKILPDDPEDIVCIVTIFFTCIVQVHECLVA